MSQTVWFNNAEFVVEETDIYTYYFPYDGFYITVRPFALDESTLTRETEEEIIEDAVEHINGSKGKLVGGSIPNHEMCARCKKYFHVGDMKLNKAFIPNKEMMQKTYYCEYDYNRWIIGK